MLSHIFSIGGELYSVMDIIITIILIVASILSFLIFCTGDDLAPMVGLIIFSIALLICGNLDKDRDISAEQMKIGECLLAQAEKESFEIQDLRVVIVRVEQNLKRQESEKIIKSSRREIHIPGLQGKFAFYTELVREGKEFLLHKREKLNKLVLRYNGFLVGDPIFSKLIS